VILYVPPTLIFFFGYGLWSARLAFYRIPRYWQARIVVSFRRCLREKKPSKLSDILPTVEKLEEMAVRAQKAASSFRIVALPHYEAVQSYLRGVAHMHLWRTTI